MLSQADHPSSAVVPDKVAVHFDLVSFGTVVTDLKAKPSFIDFNPTLQFIRTDRLRLTARQFRAPPAAPIAA